MCDVFGWEVLCGVSTPIELLDLLWDRRVLQQLRGEAQLPSGVGTPRKAQRASSEVICICGDQCDAVRRAARNRTNLPASEEAHWPRRRCCCGCIAQTELAVVVPAPSVEFAIMCESHCVRPAAADTDKPV